jgi:hypothetical protein
MRPLSFRSFSFAFLTALAACAGGPSADTTMPAFQPMPMGETAASTAPIAITQSMAEEILVAFTDRNGRRREVGFRCTWATDSAHEQLAAACANHNFASAHEPARSILTNADLDSTPGIDACREHLRARLDEVLFPCDVAGVQAQLTSVEWTTWNVR